MHCKNYVMSSYSSSTVMFTDIVSDVHYYSLIFSVNITKNISEHHLLPLYSLHSFTVLQLLRLVSIVVITTKSLVTTAYS